MNHPSASIAKPFIPSKDFSESLEFYRSLGFSEVFANKDIAEFEIGDSRFLLQNFYLKEWAENTMIQLTVDDVDHWWSHMESKQITLRFAGVKVKKPKEMPWGARVLFLHDPAGVLWHFSQWKKD